MTLIVSFEHQHTPVFIGDFLITSVGLSKKDSSTPLVHSPNKIIGSEGQRSVSSVRQKVAILHDHVCLTWSGSLLHAQSYAEYIRRFLAGKITIGYGELRAALEAYPREDVDDHLQFVIYSWHGDGWGWFSNLAPFDLGPFVQIRVGGSGTGHFVEHIERTGASKLDGNLDAYTELALRALTYAGMASAQQFFSAVGLDQWWGGGFEVAVRRNDRFAKLGPICWMFWECAEIKPMHFSVKVLPSFMYQFYVDEAAMFWIDEPEGGTNRLYAIDPPFRTVMPSTRGPENFETEIVVNTSRIKMLNGDICHGCNVDMSKGPEDRNLKIRYAEPQAKTTIEFNETFLQRLLRPMPIPNNSEVEVKFWDRKIRCMRSG